MVTGFAGYLGRVLVPILQEAGHDIYGVDNLHLGQTEEDGAPAFNYYIADVRDLHTLIGIMMARDIDAVVHLAAIVGDAFCDAAPTLAIDTNAIGTATVAEACETAGVDRLIFASTCSVYGDRGGLHPHPITLYAWTKAAAEAAIKRRTELKYTILRLGTLYGWSPRMRFDLVANVMTKDAVLKGRVSVFGGEQRRPLAHVKDVSHVIEKALQGGFAGLHDVAAMNISIKELGERISSILGAKLDIRPSDMDRRDYDADLLLSKFGVKSVKFQDAIMEIVWGWER